VADTLIVRLSDGREHALAIPEEAQGIELPALIDHVGRGSSFPGLRGPWLHAEGGGRVRATAVIAIRIGDLEEELGNKEADRQQAAARSRLLGE
jgi:hypothetical protein